MFTISKILKALKTRRASEKYGDDLLITFYSDGSGRIKTLGGAVVTDFADLTALEKWIETAPPVEKEKETR